MPETFSFYALPVAYALLVWWLSTGLIIYLDNLPARTHRWSMLGMTVMAGSGLYYLYAARGDGSAAGAYGAFTCGLVIWGWQEMSFFMGFITGPRREPCPPGCIGLARFWRAVQACLYHEIASLAGGVAVLAATSGGINQVGTWTYLVLWWMRLSAKFNVFLGVRNLSEEFIPEHLAFIRSFLRRRPMNVLFPFSIMISTTILVLLAQRAVTTGTILISIMLVLGILEHWFLVLPLPIDALWAWALRARAARSYKLEARLRWQTGLSETLPRFAPVHARIPRSIGGDT